jgi:hypothetical protein
MRRGGVILLLYLLVGVVVAAIRGYFGNLGGVTQILELIVAIVVWPLLLFGVDINLTDAGNGLNGDGGGPNGGNGGGGGGS